MATDDTGRQDAERMSLLEEAHRQHRTEMAAMRVELKALRDLVGKSDAGYASRPLAERVRALETERLNQRINGVEMHRLERILSAIATALDGE